MAILSNNPSKVSLDIISVPSESDILCGKDKTFAKHHGNLLFRDMIVSYSEVYAHALTKQSKMKITKEIVMTLQERYNARFLQPSRCGQGWTEISDQVARDKTSHALRFAAKGRHNDASKKRKPMAGARKTHRCQVSWNHSDSDSSGEESLDASSRGDRSPSPDITSSMFLQQDDIEPISYWKQPSSFNQFSIFERQQVILKNFSHEETTSSPMVRHEFDSLRSEDFESLLNDPTIMLSSGDIISDDWVLCV